MCRALHVCFYYQFPLTAVHTHTLLPHPLTAPVISEAVTSELLQAWGQTSASLEALL